MKGWVIYSRDTLSSKFGNNAFDWMVDSARKEGLTVEILFEEDFSLLAQSGEMAFYYQEQRVQKPDFALMRSYGYAVARHLESAGVPVFNASAAMAAAQDKWQTHQILASAGLPSPQTFTGADDMTFEQIASVVGEPFVMKGTLGSKGEDVYLIRDREKLEAVRSVLSGQEVIYQRFVSESAGTDIRVHVIGGKAVAAVRRRSDGDFKSNFHQGGSAQPVELTAQMAELSIRAAAALNLDFAGIDLLESAAGPSICEVNAIPGFRTICLTSDTDIPQLLFRHVADALGDGGMFT